MEHPHGRRVFVLYPNIAAVTSCEKDLFGGNKNLSTAVANPGRGRGTTPLPRHLLPHPSDLRIFFFFLAFCRVIAETVTTKDSHVYRYSLVCNLSDMNLSI